MCFRKMKNPAMFFRRETIFAIFAEETLLRLYKSKEYFQANWILLLTKFIVIKLYFIWNPKNKLSYYFLYFHVENFVQFFGCQSEMTYLCTILRPFLIAHCVSLTVCGAKFTQNSSKNIMNRYFCKFLLHRLQKFFTWKYCNLIK